MNRSDLENEIKKLYHIVDDVNDISYGVLEENLSKDDIANALDGVAVMTEIRIQRVLDTFMEVAYIKNGNDNFTNNNESYE